MIGILITCAAFDAVAETPAFGSAMYEPQTSGGPGYFVWLERRAVDQLHALRQRGEVLSGVILRLAEIEASKPGRRRGRASPPR
jgi:hypothetical protein